MRNFPFTRGRFIVMMFEPVLTLITEWMKGFIRLKNKSISFSEKSELFECFAILLASHTFGLTRDKSIELLRSYGAFVHCLERIR